MIPTVLFIWACMFWWNSIKSFCSRLMKRGWKPKSQNNPVIISHLLGAQCLSGRVLDSRPRGRGFGPHRHHCVVSLSKKINPSLVLVQPMKTHPFITERLLMGRKESNQTYKQISHLPNKMQFFDRHTCLRII